MKELIVYIFLGFLVLPLHAQTTLEKKVAIGSSKKIIFDLPYANNILVNTTSGNEILIKAKILINDGEQDGYFDLEAKERSKTLTVFSNYGKLFKRKKGLSRLSRKNKGTVIKMNHEEEEEHNSVNGIPVVIDYVIEVPETFETTIKSTTGKILVTSFKGELSIQSTSGKITVNEYEGNLDLNTISGVIDVKLGDAANLEAETTIGRIKKKEAIADLIIGEKPVGSFAKGNFPHGLYKIKANTVSGNILLRN